jgi:hypothetical protein
MVPAPMTATLWMLRWGRVAGHVFDLAGSTVGHEDVAQRAAFGGEHEVGEDLTLQNHAIVELFLGRGFDGVHALEWRRQVFRHAFDHVAGELEVRIALHMLARQIAHQGKGEPSACAAATLRAMASASSGRLSADWAMASNSFWPGNMASISLLMASPLTIMFSAASTPITRGRRCVPPAPGIRPSLTSGKAMEVPGAAMR